jgi:hypothetical protein
MAGKDLFDGMSKVDMDRKVWVPRGRRKKKSSERRKQAIVVV